MSGEYKPHAWQFQWADGTWSKPRYTRERCVVNARKPGRSGLIRPCYLAYGLPQVVRP